MRALRSLIFAPVLLSLSLAFSQEQPSATVNISQHETLGTYLVDAEGRSLYIFTKDSTDTSNCSGQCAANWPPLTADDGEPAAGAGVAPSLLGTIERADGSHQVTYFGKPLYYFVNDAAPGDTSGHGAGGFWYLVSPYGTAHPAPQAEQSADEPAGESETESQSQSLDTGAMAMGSDVFRQNCVSCHGASGQGGHGGGPALTKEARVRSEGQTITQVLRGSSYMPAFGNVLDDEQVAAVVTFIRNSWGHEFGPTTPDEVADQRQ